MSDKKNKSLRKIIFLSVGASFVYGSWAFFINHDFGFNVAIRSAIAQGILSFFVTTCMSYAMEFVFSRIKWEFARFVLTAFFPLLIVLSVMAFVHWRIGTPNIFETITPSTIVGITYCISYTIALCRFTRLMKCVSVGGFLLFMALFLNAGFSFLKHITKPQLQGKIAVNGIKGPVFIFRDHKGIPHIVAEKSDRDAFFALGFVHAQDRLWQMEFQSHIVQGRLSEIFGKKTVQQDEFLRTWGFYRAAKTVWPALNAKTQSVVQSYTNGVNAEMQKGHHPFQMIMLGYYPTHWTVYDSLGWQKMMAWQLQSSWQQKIKNYLIAEKYGKNKIPYFMPAYPASAPTTLSDTDLQQIHFTANNKEKITSANGSQTISVDHMMSVANTLHHELGYVNFPGKGSNAWVVSGKLTQSGKPLLANDVHLPLSAPALWYLVSIKGPTVNVVGASIPGLPAIVIGRNDHIAWGVTDGYNDAQDLFVTSEKDITEKHIETIRVKEGKTIHWTVEDSAHGPIVSDVTPQMKSLPLKLAIQWPALMPGDTTMQSFIALQYAHNWHDFRNAMRYFVAPTQNFVYADTRGNIGYYYPGKLPIRNGFSGALPVDSHYDWRGYIPFDQLPHVYNPKEGFIATANNRVVGNAYPYALTSRWVVPPYRIDRIRYLLTHSGVLTAEKFMSFQHDTHSYFWQDLRDTLLKIKPLDNSSKKALSILEKWNGDFSLRSEGATIFSCWVKEFSDLWPNNLAFGDKWLEPLYLKNRLNDPKMQSYLSETLSRAMKQLIKKQGRSENNWQWGKIHKAVFNEMGLGKAVLVSWIWKESIATVGGDYTVDVGTFDPNTFVQIAGATYRQVIDLGNKSHSYFIQPLGESENIFSRFYKNFLTDWRDGKYVPMTPSHGPCDPNQANCLELVPVRSDASASDNARLHIP